MIDIAAAADRLVIRTGLIRITTFHLRTRRLRWWPLLLLAVFPVAGVLMLWAPRPINAYTGYGLAASAFSASCFLRLAGPIRTATIDQPLDEREQALRAQASALGHAIAAYWVAMAFFYMSLAVALDLPRPRQPLDWGFLGFFQLTLFMLLPVLIASWRLRRPLDRDEE